MNENELIKAVGGRIAQMRRKRKMTQEQVSEAVGLEMESVSRIENGVTAPTLKRLYQFATLFQCPLTNFFPPVNNYNYAFQFADIIKNLRKDECESILVIVSEIANLLSGKTKKNF
ncbi:MAG: helix-turn-helix transcriptional regulator [Deferribacteraceae bacterium]|jgi:transcriptional regulator with XRE-family HTH domain|nr:helix-turn-helix transcriptional regulator [Deferribacteraceae bacterium]